MIRMEVQNQNQPNFRRRIQLKAKKEVCLGKIGVRKSVPPSYHAVMDVYHPGENGHAYKDRLLQYYKVCKCR